jgi:hypothetical protein
VNASIFSLLDSVYLRPLPVANGNIVDPTHFGPVDLHRIFQLPDADRAAG